MERDPTWHITEVCRGLWVFLLSYNLGWHICNSAEQTCTDEDGWVRCTRKGRRCWQLWRSPLNVFVVSSRGTRGSSDTHHDITGTRCDHDWWISANHLASNIAWSSGNVLSLKDVYLINVLLVLFHSGCSCDPWSTPSTHQSAISRLSTVNIMWTLIYYGVNTVCAMNKMKYSCT